jgi:hypothetical protein
VVRGLHSHAFATNCTSTALSNKFKDLYQKKMLTGDPHIPDYIMQAKDIYEEYKRRSDGLDGEPVEDNGNDE